MQNEKAKLLIVEDELIKRTVMEEELRDAGYSVEAVGGPLEAEPLLKKTFFDVVITDLRMPGQDGISFLKDLKKKNADQPVIVMTAYGTVETAVEAMKLGAFDYLQKPFSTEELMLKLDTLLRYENLASENEALRQQLSIRREETRIVGQSEAIRKVLARIHAISSTDTTVLIEGESGTGKELVARALHETSFRSKGAYVAISCAVLPKELVEAELFGYEAGAFTGAEKRRVGRFEIAHGGTLFLDDVDDIPLDVQIKLLRVLQERTFYRVGGSKQIRVNVRVIAASKEPLSEVVAAGRFREDLYYRLNVIPIHIPPLDMRLDDIPLLVDYFLKRFSDKFNRENLTMSPKAISKLQGYNWPGNVRELENVLERMVALSSHNNLDEQDVPEHIVQPDKRHIISLSLDNKDRIDITEVLSETEARLVRWALNKSDGNLAVAAEILNIPRSTLQYKLSKQEQPSPIPSSNNK